MRFNHTQGGDVFLYERKYLGNGRYYQRCLIPGLVSVGDEFVSLTNPGRVLIIDKIISQKDSGAKVEHPENVLYEIELIEPGDGITISPLSNI